MSKRAILGAMLLVACGEEDAPTTRERSLHEVCGELSVAACKQHTECQVTSARRVSVAGQCIAGEPVEHGCRGATGVCGDASPVARDAQGQPWLFDDTCVPPTFTLATREEMSAGGWSACAQGGAALDLDARAPYPQDASVLPGDGQLPSCEGDCDYARCDELDVASCKRDTRCRVLKAWPFDRNAKCRGDELELGCGYAGTCDPTPALAANARGDSYILAESGSGCVPAGYYASNSDLYELCNAPQVDHCAGLTYLDCDQNPQCRDGLGCPVITTPNVPGECEQRTIANCKVDSKCASMAALPLDAACNRQETVGCITLGRECHLQITYARNADGRLFELYSDDCLPTGFVGVPTAEIPQPGAGVCPVSYAHRCSALGVEHCADDPGCEPVVGEPLDLNAHCTGAPVAFACAAKSELRYDGLLIASIGGKRHRVDGARSLPNYTFYRASDKYYAAATAALLAWPACGTAP